ncbi:hypothetical protein ACVBEH_10720 [Roseateles sp. GG27B]
MIHLGTHCTRSRHGTGCDFFCRNFRGFQVFFPNQHGQFPIVTDYQSVAFKRQGLLDNKQRSASLTDIAVASLPLSAALGIAPALSARKRCIAAPISHPLIGTIADEHGDLGRSTESNHPFFKFRIET